MKVQLSEASNILMSLPAWLYVERSCLFFAAKRSHVSSQAKNQSLGAATHYSPGFQSNEFPPDGLNGIGFLVRFWGVCFDENHKITVEGRSVLEDENIDAIFDTGITQIIGDPGRIKQFYVVLEPSGAKVAPEYGDVNYTRLSGPVVLLTAAVQCLILSCNFSTPISVYVGRREVEVPLMSLTSVPYLKAL